MSAQTATNKAAPATHAQSSGGKEPRWRIKANQVQDVSRAIDGVRWRVVVEPGFDYDSIFDEETWSWAIAGHHGEIRPGNYIELHCSDQSYESLLFVRNVTPKGILVGQCRASQFEPVYTGADAEVGNYKLAWDRNQLHHVVRISDKQVVSSKHRWASSAHTAMIEMAARDQIQARR